MELSWVVGVAAGADDFFEVAVGLAYGMQARQVVLAVGITSNARCEGFTMDLTLIPLLHQALQ